MIGPMLALTVVGTPGPKGSVNAFCRRCAGARKPQQITVKEQSENGVEFRKAITRVAKARMIGGPWQGAIQVNATIRIKRQRVVRGGEELAAWVPSQMSEHPTHRNSGDIEKHVRTLHDALQDAGVIEDDAQVTTLNVFKRWADDEHPPGITFTVTPLWGW